MKKFIFIFLAILFFAGTAFADSANVIVSWTESTFPPPSDIGGYRIYYKASATAGPPYDGVGLTYNGSKVDSPIDVGKILSAKIEGLIVNQTYYFAIKAYDILDRLAPDFSPEQMFIASIVFPVLSPEVIGINEVDYVSDSGAVTTYILDEEGKWVIKPE